MNTHRRKLILMILIIFLVALILSSCSTISYYKQSVQGHLSLMSARQPIAELIASQSTTEEKKQLFKRILEIREYATQQLGLPDNGSYKSYVELDRDYVVWNVVATPEYSLTPKTWCFPVAGCVAYRGYYANQDAEKFAASLNEQEQQYDIAISGASAYSTLGWFDDPVLSSMSDRGEILLAETIFHELAHQVLYLKKDSSFNEAFATAVAIAGVRQWLSDSDPKKLDAYNDYLSRRLSFNQLIDEFSGKLKDAYSQDLPLEQKLSAKKALFKNLQIDYQNRKQEWDGFNGYDKWFAQDLNNAHLALISTYWKQVPVFDRWIIACKQDLPDFYKAVQKLAHQKQRLSDILETITPECES